MGQPEDESSEQLPQLMVLGEARAGEVARQRERVNHAGRDAGALAGPSVPELLVVCCPEPWVLRAVPGCARR